MKQVTAYIRRYMVESVLDALRQHHIHGVSVFHGQGFGRSTNGDSPHYLDKETQLGFVEVTKLEIVCSDTDADRIVGLVRQHAHTGRYGDGKIFISTVDRALDIRTGQTGVEAV